MVILRRRAMWLFSACLALLFLGVWAYQTEQQQALAGLGTQVDVIVTARAVKPWTPLTAADLVTSKVPERFAGADHLSRPDQAMGRMLITAVPKGAPLSSFILYSGPDLRPDERTWELRDGGNVLLDSHLHPGDVVDVLAAPGTGQSGVRLILTGVRVLDVRAGAHGSPAVATLAITLDDGKTLMEAENYARQVRVVRRAGGAP